jgi:hypothetical protein
MKRGGSVPMVNILGQLVAVPLFRSNLYFAGTKDSVRLMMSCVCIDGFSFLTATAERA